MHLRRAIYFFSKFDEKNRIDTNTVSMIVVLGREFAKERRKGGKNFEAQIPILDIVKCFAVSGNEGLKFVP